VYADVRGLADKFVRLGTIEALEDFDEFVRGFTRAKTMFDFIDVGAGKDSADEKIIGKSSPSTTARRDHTNSYKREL
jgi:hypothetical protein